MGGGGGGYNSVGVRTGGRGAVEVLTSKDL